MKWLFGAVFVSLLLCAPATLEARAEVEADPARQVAQAIQSIRGVKLEGLSSTEKDALAERLNNAWQVLLDHRKIAAPVVRHTLMTEQNDSFLIIDLSRFLLMLDGGKESTMLEVAQPLSRCDPNAYGRGFFEIVASMSARHCIGCLPAVLKILEVRKLEAYIEAHALPVNNELGLVFTVLQYGDDALEALRQGIGSDNCAVRANSVLAFGMSLPDTYPETIRRMATQDTCPQARHAAWEALDWVGDPTRGRLVTERLASEPVPEPEERRAMILSLSGAFSLSVMPSLEKLAADSDPDLASFAKSIIEAVSKSAATMTRLRTGTADGPQPRGSKVRRALRRAVDTGRLESSEDGSELLAALRPDDIPQVKRARIAVLARLSDECLSEYHTLTYVVMGLRHLANARVN